MSIDTYSQTAARNIGNSTAEILKVKIGDDNSFRAQNTQTINVDQGSATYRVVDTNYAGEALIKLDILANYLNANKKIDAFIKIDDPPPQFFSKTALADSAIIFNYDQASFKDTNNPTLNADIHSNSLIMFNGYDYFGEGFITSAGDVFVGEANINVVPNNNLYQLPLIQYYVAPLAIPDFVASNYQFEAHLTYDGDWTFTGNIILGTESNPKIIYVDGRAIFNATSITGFGIIIASQDIEVNGDITIDSPNSLLSQFGMFTSGKFTVNNSNITIEATIFCQNELTFNDQDINLIGSITSKNKITFNGLRNRLFYKPPYESIISPFFELVYKRPKIAYWYE
jgi:hypothetical protein